MNGHRLRRAAGGVVTGGPVTVENISSRYTGIYSGTPNTKSFSGCDFGSAFSGRVVVAIIVGNDGATHSISSVTIGGINATEMGYYWNGSRDAFVGIYAAFVPTGTTGTVTFNHNTWPNNSVLRVLSLSGVEDLTVDDLYEGSTSTINRSMNIPTDGINITAICDEDGTSNSLSPVTDSIEFEDYWLSDGSTDIDLGMTYRLNGTGSDIIGSACGFNNNGNSYSVVSVSFR